MRNPLTTRETAAEINRELRAPGAVREWQVRRLFENGELDEPPKFGGKRMVDRGMLPEIVAALRDRGWLPKTQLDVPTTTSAKARQHSPQR